MEVQVESLSAVEKKLIIRIPVERVQKELDDAYRNLQRDVVLPGFRRGKVPRRFLEHRFGAHVRGEVGSRLITETFEEAARTQGVEPVSQPTIERTELKDGHPYEFSVLVEVRPQVNLPDYVGVPIQFDAVGVDDGAIDAEVEKLRKASGEVRAVDEARAIAPGDLALVDYTLRAEGVSDYSQQDYLLSEGDPSHSFLWPLVVGRNPGDGHTATVTLPARFYQKRFAGKDAAVEVTVKGIRAIAYPEVDDRFASEQGSESLEALRASIRFRLEEAAGKQQDTQARDHLAHVLVDRTAIEVPPGLQRAQAEQMIRNTTAQLQARGMKLRSMRLDDLDAENRDKVMEEAAFAIRRSLVLEAIADAEKIEVTDDDLDDRVRELADQAGQRFEAVKGTLTKNHGLDEVRARLREDRTLDFLMERAEISTRDPEPSAPAEAAAPGAGSSD